MISAAKHMIASAMLMIVVVCLGLSPASASKIKYVVNNIPITTYDIERRAAFLKLQRQSRSASEVMIEQTLQASEMRRLNIRISDKAVDDAYARFAAGNKLTLAQLDQIMSQSGVTKAHFREFIRVQMGWNQALGQRFRAQAQLSDQDVAAKMLKKGGAKPSATEYMLQQVIFVVPESERSALLAKRKREAEAMRTRFNGCETTRQFAKGLIDVTVRDLGRVLAPELPPDWAETIKNTKPGGATTVRETNRGVEFIGVCSSREVSDDRVARMILQTESEPDDKGAELSKTYLEELRKKARIVER